MRKLHQHMMKHQQKQIGSQDLDFKFRRRMFHLLGIYADAMGMYHDESMAYLKDKLRAKRMIKESTTELDIKGLAKTCALIGEWIKKNQLPI